MASACGAAVHLLTRNEISVSVFAQAVFTLLEKGRGKYRNIFIHGVANCGKSFMLSPLKAIVPLHVLQSRNWNFCLGRGGRG